MAIKEGDIVKATLSDKKIIKDNLYVIDYEVNMCMIMYYKLVGDDDIYYTEFFIEPSPTELRKFKINEIIQKNTVRTQLT